MNPKIHGTRRGVTYTAYQSVLEREYGKSQLENLRLIKENTELSISRVEYKQQAERYRKALVSLAELRILPTAYQQELLRFLELEDKENVEK